MPQPTPAIIVTAAAIAICTSVEAMPAVFVISPQPDFRSESGTDVSAWSSTLAEKEPPGADELPAIVYLSPLKSVEDIDLSFGCKLAVNVRFVTHIFRA